MTAAVHIRRLTGADAAPFRELRLEALRDHPDAFRSSWEEDQERSLDHWRDFLDSQFVVGGGLGPDLLQGMATFMLDSRLKTRHRGVLGSVFVRSAARRTGLSVALIEAVITEARANVEDLSLVVSSHNLPAIRLYRSLGFEERWTETRSLKVGDRYFDETTMGMSLWSLHSSKSSPIGRGRGPAKLGR